MAETSEDIENVRNKVVRDSDDEDEEEQEKPIPSDDSDDEVVTTKAKPKDSDSDEEEEEEEEEKVLVKKRRKVQLKDSDEESEDEPERDREKEEVAKGSDDEETGNKSDSSKNSSKDSDDDDEDEDEDDKDDDVDEGKEADDAKEGSHKSDANEESDQSDDDSNEPRRSSQNDTIYDFDIMMAKKKEENSRRRKRRGYDIINDNDDIIADIIQQMKDAVEADSEANRNKQAATRKLKLLPFVISQLRKVDLRDAFFDSDVLSVITEWLAPLPDRSLPHLAIREDLLKILIDFNLSDVDRIKSSGIGKAIMYLYKHPKETRENKQRAKQLISCWSRPIFQLDSSFSSISREEREQRDLELMSKQRRTSRNDDSSDGEGAGPSSGAKKLKEEPAAQKPGEKGWIPRARVPAPSMKDYVIRPRSKVDGDIGKSSKRPSNMLEKYMKSQQDRKRANRQQRAINMKIDRI